MTTPGTASTTDARKRNAEREQSGSFSPTGPTSPTSTYSTTTNADLRPLPAAGEAATEGGELAALPHARTPSGGAVMTIHKVRLFWSGYVLTVLNSIVLGACLERMLR